MSRSHQIWFAVLLVILGVALWRVLAPPLNPFPEIVDLAPTAPPVVQSEKAPLLAHTTEAKPINAPVDAADVIRWDRIAALAKGESGKLATATDADIERFLARHGKTANNLVAAFEATDNPKWLEQALELFPQSPVVLFTALSQVNVWKDARAGSWLERFKAMDAKSPLPWLYAASARYQEGNSPQAMEELRAAQGRPGFYTYSNERMDAAQALYESMGLGKTEAGLMSMCALRLPWLQTVMGVSKNLEIAKKAEAASAELIQDTNAIQYQLGRMFQTPEASRMLLGQLVGVAVEKRGMAVLSEEDQARRNGELDAQRKEMSSLSSNLDSLIQSQNGALLSDYLRRLRIEGELPALRWLKSQMK